MKLGRLDAIAVCHVAKLGVEAQVIEELDCCGREVDTGAKLGNLLALLEHKDIDTKRTKSNGR